MCGFVGVVGKKLNKKTLRNAAKTILHRGPDNTSFLVTNELSLAFNRLSIIDRTKRSHQPFILGEIKVFANGEIFNYIELRKRHSDFKPKTSSDIEIIPFLYIKYGINFLSHLNGMFSIVLIDNKKKINYFIRDRYGEKPLFYTKKDKLFYFSSEIKSLNSLTPLEPSKLNIKINFNYGFVPQPYTLYKNTFSIKPGHYIECRNNKIVEKQWYQLKIIKKLFKEKNVNKLKRLFLQEFKNSVSMRLRADTKVGVFLSGGIDSNFISGIIKKYFNKNYKKLFFFNCVLLGKNEIENNTDSNITIPGNPNFHKEVINHDYYNKNIVKVVDSLDFVLLDSGTLIFYFLSSMAKKRGVKVVLNGIGADEIFGGYYWQNQILKIPNFLRPIVFKRKIILFLKLSIILKKKITYISNALSFFASPLEWHIRTWTNSFGNFFKYEDKKKMFNKIYLLNQSFYRLIENIKTDFMNLFNYLTIQIFALENHHKIDLATMNSSIESRAPFFDHNIIEMMMSVRHKLKIKEGHKSLLKFFSKNIVSDKILNMKKSGPTLNLKFFFPIKKYFLYLNFVKKNKHIIISYLGIIFYNKFIKNFSDKSLFLENLPNLFAIINFILWYKIKIQNSIKNKKNITMNEILNIDE
jgi:asparagine synthase (glutamine-hydrolysing)